MRFVDRPSSDLNRDLRLVNGRGMIDLATRRAASRSTSGERSTGSSERCSIKCTLELHSWRRERAFWFPCGLFSASASTLANSDGKGWFVGGRYWWPGSRRKSVDGKQRRKRWMRGGYVTEKLGSYRRIVWIFSPAKCF